MMAELLAAFAAWRADIESEPFAHQQWWDLLVGDVRKEDTP